MYNADQTAVAFEYLPCKTINSTGQHTVWVKCDQREKKLVTAMVLGDSTGNKYPLFVVMKTALSKVQSARVENEKLCYGIGRRL